MVVIGGLGSVPGAVLGSVYVLGTAFFLPPAWAPLASGAGLLLLLMFLPGGLGELVFRARDSWLRYVARSHGIVVPSLVADVLVTTDEGPVIIDAALDGMAGTRPQGEPTVKRRPRVAGPVGSPA